MDKKAFRNDFECITYNCHSADSRVQFSMSEGGMREFEGSDANRETIQSASSMSRKASMKVGYLRSMREVATESIDGFEPFFDDMIQAIDRLVILKTFCTTPLAPTQGTS
jgi:hypothetical protein